MESRHPLVASSVLVVATLSLNPTLLAQNETPHSHVSVVIAPNRWEFSNAEDTVLAETGDPGGQMYITVDLQQKANPGLNPIIDLADHIRYVDGTDNAGVLFHSGHGGSDKSISMENFTDADDATAMQAAMDRLNFYATAAGGSYDIAGADREIEISQLKSGQWAIFMFDRTITNRGKGLAPNCPLVHISTCYGILMGPAYVGKGARVVVGPKAGICAGPNAASVSKFYTRMNGREGQAKRPVSQARSGIADWDAVGKENTTLAPSVLSLVAPCPIKSGDFVVYTFDTTCDQNITPNIIGAGCTIQNETWLSATKLQGKCTDPPPPGSKDFTLTLYWSNTCSANNAACLDGNTNPAGVNACCPAHDNYKRRFRCDSGPLLSPVGLSIVALLFVMTGAFKALRPRLSSL